VSELHFVLDLPGLDGKLVITDIALVWGTVEFRCQYTLGCDKVVGTTQRVVLREWLFRPFGVFIYDDMVWAEKNNRITVRINDVVPECTLEPEIIDTLKAFV